MSHTFKRISSWQLVRHNIQLAAFLLVPALFAIIFASLGSLTAALAHGSWTWKANGADTFLVLAILAVTALAGRFFCSFFCAFGAMEEALGALGRRLHLQNRNLPSKADRLGRGFKYLILAGLAACWVMGWNLPEGASPWSAFGQALTFPNPQPSALLTVGGMLLIAIALASLMVEHFFCRYLCPLGAVLALASRPRLYRIRKPLAGCASHCSACSQVCQMGLDLRQTNVVHSGECINCLACRDICPQENVQANPQPAMAAAAMGVVLSGCYLAGTALPQGPSQTASLIQTAVSPAFQLADGTYSGSGEGYRGQTLVSVTVENGSVTDISIDASDDDASFLQDAQTGLIPAILAQQNLEVQPVSGATYSSRGILEAVADALGVNPAASNDSASGQHNDENSYNFSANAGLSDQEHASHNA